MSYNPFDDDADLMLYVQFGASMNPKARREARHAAILWCLKQGFLTLDIAKKVGVSVGLVSHIRGANDLTEDRSIWMKRASQTKALKAGKIPMTFERANLLRADAATMTSNSLAEKYDISVSNVCKIKKNIVWTS